MNTPLRSSILLACLALFVVGCTTTETIFVDREPFNPPPDAAAGLLGYYDVEDQQTTCGNCHVGHQRDWATTHHSEAYETLTDWGDAPAFCFSCHATTQNGNDLTEISGWDFNANEAYQDVQCESCHGPGTEHVQAPENQATIPLARYSMAEANGTCADCHTGSHHGFADEWAQSGHASVNAYPAGRTGCANCHEAKAALASWGERSNYVEVDDATLLPPTTCALCHDPHGSDNEHQLRWPVNTADVEQNLCMKCHLRRGEPNAGSHGDSPHAPQAFVVLGIGMYRPGNVIVDTLISLTTHASDRNPRLCAGCHVNRFTITDPESGDFVFNSTGHLFQATPCIDGQGVPIADQSCDYTPTQRSFKSCATAGCHETEAIAAGRLNGSRLDIKLLADQIWTDLNGDEHVDAAPTDGGLLAIVKRDNPEAFTNTEMVTPAVGAVFNVKTFAEGRTGHPDGSKGTHNAFLARALLSANILELQQTYGLGAVSREAASVMDRSVREANQRQPGFIATTTALH